MSSVLVLVARYMIVVVDVFHPRFFRFCPMTSIDEDNDDKEESNLKSATSTTAIVHQHHHSASFVIVVVVIIIVNFFSEFIWCTRREMGSNCAGSELEW